MKRGGRKIDMAEVWPYTRHMAVTTIKSTYSLDVESMRTLEKLAQRWNVSKSAVLRRAIRIAATDGGPATMRHGVRLTGCKARSGRVRSTSHGGNGT